MKTDLTNKQILSLPEGTKIRVKDHVKAHQKFKDGGVLTIDYDNMEPGDRPFGIAINGFGACYSFKAAEYELI